MNEAAAPSKALSHVSPGRVRLKIPMPADPLGKLTESRRVVFMDFSRTQPYITNCGAGVAHQTATSGQTIWKNHGLSAEYKLDAQASFNTE